MSSRSTSRNSSEFEMLDNCEISDEFVIDENDDGTDAKNEEETLNVEKNKTKKEQENRENGENNVEEKQLLEKLISATIVRIEKLECLCHEGKNYSISEKQLNQLLEENRALLEENKVLKEDNRKIKEMKEEEKIGANVVPSGIPVPSAGSLWGIGVPGLPKPTSQTSSFLKNSPFTNYARPRESSSSSSSNSTQSQNQEPSNNSGFSKQSGVYQVLQQQPRRNTDNWDSQVDGANRSRAQQSPEQKSFNRRNYRYNYDNYYQSEDEDDDAYTGNYGWNSSKEYRRDYSPARDWYTQGSGRKSPRQAQRPEYYLSNCRPQSPASRDDVRRRNNSAQSSWRNTNEQGTSSSYNTRRDSFDYPARPRSRFRWIAYEGYRSTKTSYPCVYCGDMHLADQCHVVETVEKRREYLIDDSRCLRCLKGHSGRCFKDYVCYYCFNDRDHPLHHSSICPFPQNDYSSEH